MSTVAPAAALAGLATAPQAPTDRAQLKQAARQFEAIFVRQMLSAARAAKLGGENDLFGGQAMETFNGMQDERFAQIAADSGAFGLAKSIETQLAAQIGLAREGASTSSARADQGSVTYAARPEPVEGPRAAPQPGKAD